MILPHLPYPVMQMSFGFFHASVRRQAFDRPRHSKSGQSSFALKGKKSFGGGVWHEMIIATGSVALFMQYDRPGKVLMSSELRIR